MKILGTGILIAMCVAAMGIAGCDVELSGRGHHDRGYVAVQAQPAYVQPQPQYVAPQPQYVVTQQAPPPLIVESQPPPPSPQYVWIDGSWNWNNQRYVWAAGRYELPPQQGSVWVAPRYDHDSRGYRYTPGQWKKPNQDNGHDHQHGTD